MMNLIHYKIDKISSKFRLSNYDKTDKLRFSLSFRFKVNVEEQIICCVSQYLYKTDQETLMDLELECYFKVMEDYFRSQIKEDTLTIDTNILQYLATIAVGTARGEIHARCAMADSPLQNIVLPPVNLTKIITSPAEFNI